MNFMHAICAIRRLRRFLAGPEREDVLPQPFHRQTMAWRQTALLVRIYYVALSYLAISLLPSWNGYVAMPLREPLWPVAWLFLLPIGVGPGIYAILSLYIAGPVLAALFPQWRTARFLAWLGLFQFVAFNNSFGKIGHSLHGWVLTALVLVFLPSGGKEASERRIWRQSYLQVFTLAQVIFMLIYSMAGLGKVLGCLYQAAVGEMTVLHPMALAYQVAERLIQTDANSDIGTWLINHYWVGWIPYIAMVYIQFFSIWAIFRPAMQRPWALALVLFHVGSFFIFTILFTPNILLIGFFLIASPSARPWSLGLAFWRDLPLIGRGIDIGARWLAERRKKREEREGQVQCG